MLYFILLVLVCIGIASVVKGIYNKGFADGQDASKASE